MDARASRPDGPDAAPSDTIAELRAALRHRDEFLASLAHELRNAITPVASIVEFLDATASAAPDTMRIAPVLGRLTTATQRFVRRATLLLEASRFVAGERYRATLQPVDLSLLVGDAVAAAAPGAELVGSAIEASIEPSVLVLSDGLALELILDNLLSNAIKYGAGRPITVALERGEASTVRLRVRDRGIGIARDDRARIFERFERADGALAKPGFGIGLSVARTMADAIGGRIDLESEVGLGATFTVTLPLCAPSETA